MIYSYKEDFTGRQCFISLYNSSLMDNLSDKDNLADKRLSKEQVRKLLTRILKGSGDIQFTSYAERRMLERGITAQTVVNVLERGKVRDGEAYHHQDYRQWRYRVETDRYRVVVTFQVSDEIIVINAIDFKVHLISSVTRLKKGDDSDV